MTLEQFKYLDLKAQEFILQTKAVFIASMQDEEHVYNLFQVDGFYLEVNCNLKETVVRSLSYYEDTELLEPYLKLIDIGFAYKLLE
jgi:hypothetical protein